jgi:hypothetical protein
VRAKPCSKAAIAGAIFFGTFPASSFVVSGKRSCNRNTIGTLVVALAHGSVGTFGQSNRWMSCTFCGIGTVNHRPTAARVPVVNERCSRPPGSEDNATSVAWVPFRS